MQNGFFLFLFIEIFLFNAPFRETAQRAAPAKAFCDGVLCAAVSCGTMRMLDLKVAPQNGGRSAWRHSVKRNVPCGTMQQRVLAAVR